MPTNQLPVPGNTPSRTKFLTVVWGEAYIRRFVTLSLPSFLAPGNLPALAQNTDLEVVIMTRRDDVEHFENHVAFRRLRTICPVRFVGIDDLITTSVYGVTLTLAFARPVIACGSEMLNTHFVFMNADFVLADGSLRALCKHILAGRSIVLGPSFRATAEAVGPRLQAAVDASSGVLAIPPRQLAALSLPHPHPTTVAKIVNQGFCHSTHPNQFFWQVDDRTLLGRYYLILMLCLKPERIVESINCFCDYAFIPQMCPSGDEVAMDDSDDFFMLELQSRNQEIHLLRLGRQTDEEIVRSLREWTTAEHRRAARYDIVFHVGDIPPEIEATKAEARAFVDRIGRKLGRAVPHEQHHYWIRGVAAWRHLRKVQGLSASPPELTPPTAHRQFARRLLRAPLNALVNWSWAFAYAARRAIFGQWPRLTPFHPSWMDSRHLRDVLAAILGVPGARVLVVRSEPELVDPLIGSEGSVQFANLQTVLDSGLSMLGQGSEGFTHALVYLLRKDCRHTRRLIEQCEAAMTPGGIFQVFIHHLRGAAEEHSFSHELVAYVEEILPSPCWTAECSFVGGSLKRGNQRFMNRLYGYHARFGTWALFWTLPLLAVVLPVTLIGNLYLRMKGPSRHFVPYCSSASIRFAPLRGDTTRTCERLLNAAGADSKTDHSRMPVLTKEPLSFAP